MSELRFPSHLSSNVILIELLDTGELEITFDGGNESWGERLHAQDAQWLIEELSRQLAAAPPNQT